MAQGGKMTDFEFQADFMYLFERMSEPLGYGVKGSGDNMVYYKPPSMQPEMESNINSGMMDKVKHKVNIAMPKTMPMKELTEISTLCPKSGLFGYFIPAHRRALIGLRNVLLDQPDVKELHNMASFCRDSSMIHPHLFVHALTSCLANRPDTKKFISPVFYEIMPELFFSDHVTKQAEKMARMPDTCKNRIMVDRNTTGHQSDPESRLWYFREDIGVNSHHFHWHVVFPGDYGTRQEMKQDRRGELFYYMHHSMISRYDVERLCNGLNRTKLFDFDNMVLEEGYFGKLHSTNSGRHWGTRQPNTKLQNILNDGEIFFNLKVEDLKRWRDRILEAIDTGVIIRRNKDGSDKRDKLTEETGVDILGEIIENSQDTPHAQFYGRDGFHNMGHVLIAFANDPLGRYRENIGPMGDTSTAMRDPAFYRWHKYLDDMFDKYKKTLTPYQINEGKWPLEWTNIKVDSIKVKTSNPKYQGVSNTLSTHWGQTDVDLSRGLDFFKTQPMNEGPVFATFTHVNYHHFEYEIQVTNNTGRLVRGTVRIFLAPKNDEHGVPFKLNMQRLLFFEMDKFTTQLKPGSNNLIKRKSTDSSVCVKFNASFEMLETLNSQIGRDDFRTGEDMSRCGCGWPAHLLLPRGTPGSGMPFDLFVMVTDGSKDVVQDSVGPPGNNEKKCHDAISFCGVLNQKYPDARPMGFPFDREPFNHPKMQEPTPVASIGDYVSFISNAATAEIRIVHEPDLVISTNRKKNGMGMVNEKGEVMETPGCSSSTPSGAPPAKGRFPQSATNPETRKNERGGRILPQPPTKNQSIQFPGQGQYKQWQGHPRGGYYGHNRGARDEQDQGAYGGEEDEGMMDGDWDYVDHHQQ